MRAEAPLLRTLLHDIAERQKVEARLRETQEWMHLAQSAGGVASYTYDYVSGALLWSPSAYALYGFDPDIEPDFETWLNAVHPEDLDAVAAAVATTLERGADFDQEYRLVRPDGAVRWVHDRGRVGLDDQGRPLRLAGLIVDVTEPRAREAALRDSEARFRALAEASAAVTWRMDAKGGLIGGCPSWSALTGQSEVEFAGLGWTRAVHPDDRAAAARAWDQALSTGAPYGCDFRVRRADGENRMLRARAMPLLDERGAVREWVGAAVDITDVRRTVLELKDREERLRAALDGSGAGTFRWDIKTNALDWDAALDRLFGLPEGVTTPSLQGFIAQVHPDDRDAVVAACERCASDGADFEMTFRVVWPDGSLHWISDRGKTYRDADGRPSYMTGACIDVTERHIQVAQLRASEERLRLAQEAGHVGAFEWFPDTNLLVGSEQYFRLWGLPQTGVIRGDDLIWRLHPEDRPLAGPSRIGQLQSALDYAEYRIVRADTGEQRWLARRGQMIDDGGGPPRMFGVVYDITERKQAENRLNTVLESVTDGFVGVDASWRIILFNGAAERHFGIARHKVIGRVIWEALSLPEDGPVGDAMRRVMETRLPLTIEAESIVGHDRAIELRIAPKLEGGLATSFSDVTQRRDAERHRELLVNELNHRVKNSLAIVQAMANQTLRRGGVSREITEAFEGRLGALARAHDILTRRNWDDAFLQELVATALAPFTQAAGERIVIAGPELRLPARTAVSFALAVHELATNASKYGALSNDAGRVAVRWRIARLEDGAWLKLSWREDGGPPVAEPPRRGFGSRMIEHALSTELRGQVRLEFARTGVSCTVNAPLPYLDLAARRRRPRAQA